MNIGILSLPAALKCTFLNIFFNEYEGGLLCKKHSCIGAHANHILSEGLSRLLFLLNNIIIVVVVIVAVIVVVIATAVIAVSFAACFALPLCILSRNIFLFSFNVDGTCAILFINYDNDYYYS